MYDKKMSFIQKHQIALLIFSCALLMRLIFAMPVFMTPNPTSGDLSLDGYYEISENLLNHHGFSRSPLKGPTIPDSVRLPLYTLLIAAVVKISGSYKLFLLIQIIVGSCIPLLGRRLVDLLTHSPSFAFPTGLFLALEPLNAWLPSVLLSETFFTFFFLLGSLLFLQYLSSQYGRHIILAGLCFGLATLVRPTTQYYPLLLIGIILFKQWRPNARTIKHLVAFLCVFLLSLTPWLYRNYHVFGTPALSVQSTSILYAYFVPSVIALESHTSFSNAQEKWSGGGVLGGIDDINIGNAHTYRDSALRELVQHPVGIMKSLSVTCAAFFTNDGYRSFTSRYPLFTFQGEGITASAILHHPAMLISLLTSPGILLILFGRILWIMLTLFACAGAYRYLKDEEFSIQSTTIILTILYFILTTALVGLGVNGRFRVPIDVFIVMLALYGCRYIAARYLPAMKPQKIR